MTVTKHTGNQATKRKTQGVHTGGTFVPKSPGDEETTRELCAWNLLSEIKEGMKGQVQKRRARRMNRLVCGRAHTQTRGHSWAKPRLALSDWVLGEGWGTKESLFRLSPSCLFPKKKAAPWVRRHQGPLSLDCYWFFQKNKSKCLTPFITGLMGVMEKIRVSYCPSRHEIVRAWT